MNNNQINKISISTITLSSQLPNCNLLLTNIGKYLDISDKIIGIKYCYGNLNVIKGKYSTTVYKKAKLKKENKINKTLFYNQITLIYNNSGNHVNIKIFGNGSLHLTGCKTIEEGNEITKCLYNELNNIRYKIDNIILTKDSNNVYIDKDNLIYGYNNKRILGHKKEENLYIINNKEYEIDCNTGLFISKKLETQRRKFLLDFDGNEIGFTKIELLKNKNKFYKKNSNIFVDYTNNLIYHNNDVIIGKISYNIKDNTTKDNDNTIKQMSEIYSKMPDVLEIEYKCNPFKSTDYVLNYDCSNIKTDVNCINVVFNLNYEINRQKLYDKLIDMKMICKYKPETYSGIKFTYKLAMNEDNSKGKCYCTSKCTCTNITFLIFQSGSVIATGFKNYEQINNITSEFLNLCNNIKLDIQKRENL